ncbi:serpin-ZX-like [Lotus japonicus]|uniref:serpin-ZX-like n=1 Tax=Lotus japonicus TaxID=34305 RepID=UPI002583DCC5|nr:serpin-ZX-like [Lotus japonicus]
MGLKRLFSSCFNNQVEKSSTSCNKQTEVALRIANHLFSKEEYHDKNLVFSPLSLYMVLSIIAAGSKGATLDELLTFLQSDSVDHLNSLASQLVSALLSDGAAPLYFVNGAWADQSLSLSSSFKQVVTTDYKANVALRDFNQYAEVANEVNSWVEKKTNGLIKQLLPDDSVDKYSKLIFVNALYFKGVWKNKFDVSETKKHDFHLLNRTSVKVPFMVGKNKEHFISAFNGFKVIHLPYKQGENKQFSMYIFLPDKKNGLSSLIKKIVSESGFLEHNLPWQRVEVRLLMIPKFKISFGLETSKVLKELGVSLPFSNQADLTNMVDFDEDDLYVEAIFHKASVEVNEEGTDAAAATGAILAKGGSIPSKITDFVADHPFIFLIRQDFTETIFFIGQVLNPLADDASSNVIEYQHY